MQGMLISTCHTKIYVLMFVCFSIPRHVVALVLSWPTQNMLKESVLLLTTALLHAGSYQSLSWGVSAIGGILSAYFSGSLIQDYGVTFVFGLTAVFPLLTLGAALLIEEQRVTKKAVRSPCSCMQLRTK